MPSSDADKSAYCACLEALKPRLQVVRALVARSLTTGNESFDGEIACLQLRKALEFIAFATLAANRDRYAEAHRGLTGEWKASRILDRLEQMNRDFYPVPLVVQGRQPDGTWNFAPLTDGYLTKDDFTFLYDRCSDAIHTWNPFRPGPRVIDLNRNFAEWVARIERLLDFHYIRLVDQSELLVVYFNHPTLKSVAAFSATP
jgi:hypothetical protein